MLSRRCYTPTFCYRVRGSDEVVERFFRSHKDKTDTIETDDGRLADFDFMATVSGVHTVPAGAYPVYSRSMGVRKEDLAEARRRFPGHRFTEDGRRIIGDQGELKRVLRDLNRDAVPGFEIGDLR